MSITNAFKRLHYLTDVIAQCVRWYLAYSLRLRLTKVEQIGKRLKALMLVLQP